MSGHLLGIDFGTGGAKVCIIDEEGRILGTSFEEYALIHEHPGWSEHDAKNYWPLACKLVKSALNKSAIDPKTIRGIAASSALPSLVLVDKNHTPVHRAYTLMDKRAIDTVSWLKSEVGEERIISLSGYRLEDHPVLVNVLWEKENRPEAFRRVWKALTIDGYIALKLTGEAVVNTSGAATFGVAYDIRRRRFDETMLSAIGLDPEVLPKLAACEAIIGEVTRQAAAESGLSPGIPVAAGQVDCNASWIGAGAIEPGDLQSNLGTVGNFGIVHSDTEFIFSDIGKRMLTVPYTINSEEWLVTVPTTITGGQTIRYIRDNLSQAEVAAEASLGVSSYDLLNLQAERVPPGSDGLLVLPYLMGERSPIWDAQARGVVFGLSLSHTKGHLVRAMMEAVAFAMYDSFRLIQEAGLYIKQPMVMNEGGAVSPLWRRIMADVFNIPVSLAKQRGGAPFGNAILAGVASGVFKDFSVALRWADTTELMEPDEGTHEVYMEYFALYKELYEHLREDFQTLRQLRARLTRRPK